MSMQPSPGDHNVRARAHADRLQRGLALLCGLSALAYAGLRTVAEMSLLRWLHATLTNPVPQVRRWALGAGVLSTEGFLAALTVVLTLLVAVSLGFRTLSLARRGDVRPLLAPTICVFLVAALLVWQGVLNSQRGPYDEITRTQTDLARSVALVILALLMILLTRHPWSRPRSGSTQSH